jgi:hypothetical protein
MNHKFKKTFIHASNIRLLAHQYLLLLCVVVIIAIIMNIYYCYSHYCYPTNVFLIYRNNHTIISPKLKLFNVNEILEIHFK